jgi:AAA domain, putative AbiEii toxin, Type IV TA system/AAA ATPase domain
MLTKLTIRNFKGFQEAEIELGQNVVFIGPNNSGKTTALQALALWRLGLEEWLTWFIMDMGERATLNRLDLPSLPVPYAELLWHNLQTQENEMNDLKIMVDGINDDGAWHTDIRFRYANDESLYCDLNTSTSTQMMPGEFPPVEFLTPMSGLTSVEPRVERGRINVLIGEGRTAEVLRNLCYQLYEENGKTGNWDKLVAHIKTQFGIQLLAPNYLPARGEIRMAYTERTGITLDLASSGRGMLQVLLLLAYMYNNPNAVLLLDEPDAHLEIIRQRDIYRLLTEVAREQHSQIIAASHSEVVLEEAAGRDTAIAFVGKPHRIDQRNKSQVSKALREIRAVDYYLAEQTGWVLYLEGSTDLAILQTFAQRLKHEAAPLLERAFVYYLESNKPSKAHDHFHGLHEAKNDLVGVALYDRIPASKLQKHKTLTELVWQRREIENYLFQPHTLLAYARQDEEANKRVEIMQSLISDNIPPIALRDPAHQWWRNTKASDDFLDLLFEQYYAGLNLPNIMQKTNYHILANYVPLDKIDPEIVEKLDAIVAVAKQAKPRTD